MNCKNVPIISRIKIYYINDLVNENGQAILFKLIDTCRRFLLDPKIGSGKLNWTEYQ